MIRSVTSTAAQPVTLATEPGERDRPRGAQASRSRQRRGADTARCSPASARVVGACDRRRGARPARRAGVLVVALAFFVAALRRRLARRVRDRHRLSPSRPSSCSCRCSSRCRSASCPRRSRPRCSSGRSPTGRSPLRVARRARSRYVGLASHALGPALVLALAGGLAAALDRVADLPLALAAQFATRLR